jgi:hypothetical protein
MRRLGFPLPGMVWGRRIVASCVDCYTARPHGSLVRKTTEEFTREF